jgi:hypothetical protein
VEIIHDRARLIATGAGSDQRALMLVLRDMIVSGLAGRIQVSHDPTSAANKFA